MRLPETHTVRRSYIFDYDGKEKIEWYADDDGGSGEGRRPMVQYAPDVIMFPGDPDPQPDPDGWLPCGWRRCGRKLVGQWVDIEYVHDCMAVTIRGDNGKEESMYLIPRDAIEALFVERDKEQAK